MCGPKASIGEVSDESEERLDNGQAHTHAMRPRADRVSSAGGGGRTPTSSSTARSTRRNARASQRGTPSAFCSKTTAWVDNGWSSSESDHDSSSAGASCYTHTPPPALPSACLNRRGRWVGCMPRWRWRQHQRAGNSCQRDGMRLCVGVCCSPWLGLRLHRRLSDRIQCVASA